MRACSGIPYGRAKRIMNTASWYVCVAAVSADRNDGAGLILVVGRGDAFGRCLASQMAQRRFLASLSTTSPKRLWTARTRERATPCVGGASVYMLQWVQLLDAI